MAEDCRLQQFTHTRHLDFPFPVGVGLSLLLFVVSAWLFCCLVPLARASFSVRGVGCSRPEPWTRLHCNSASVVWLLALDFIFTLCVSLAPEF